MLPVNKSSWYFPMIDRCRHCTVPPKSEKWKLPACKSQCSQLTMTVQSRVGNTYATLFKDGTKQITFNLNLSSRYSQCLINNRYHCIISVNYCVFFQMPTLSQKWFISGPKAQACLWLWQRKGHVSTNTIWLATLLVQKISAQVEVNHFLWPNPIHCSKCNFSVRTRVQNAL